MSEPAEMLVFQIFRLKTINDKASFYLKNQKRPALFRILKL